MLKRIIWGGLGSGAIIGAFLLVVTWMFRDVPFAENNWGMLLGYASMLLGLSLVFIAIKRQRDMDNGGVIRFLPAFGMGLAITLVASVVYALAWEVTLAVTGLDFAGEYGKAVVDMARAKGVSGEELAAVEEKARHFMEQYNNPAFRIPMTCMELLPVGALVSLISAALLRNSRFLAAR